MWKPIPFEEIAAKISESEVAMEPQVRAFWELVKVVPRKWDAGEYGGDGGDFWVVAVLGERVIWYNDIEEGFNVSAFEEYGTIKELLCNQSELHWEVRWLWQNTLDRLSSGTSLGSVLH